MSELDPNSQNPSTPIPSDNPQATLYKSPKKPKTNWWLMGLIALILAGLAWLVYQRTVLDKQGDKQTGKSANAQAGGGKRGGASGAGASQNPAVGVATVVQQDIPLQITALGTVTSVNTAIVRPQTTGTLQKIFFKEGDMVKQGQLLAQLDNRSLQASILQAEGQLQKDTALLENAKLDLQRYQLLKSQNSIATQQVDTQASLVKQYMGAVKIDQANITSANVNLSYARVVAPISGRIGLLQTTLGNLVSASDTNGIATITQSNPMSVVFGIPENQLNKIRQANASLTGLTAEAWNKDSTKKLAQGQLIATDSQINTATGTLNLKALFNNADGLLFPNQFVNIKLNLGKISNAVAVPNSAIQVGKVGSFVYVVNDDNTVKVTPVTVGTANDSTSEITQGLSAGQKVVVDGLDKLRDGGTITPIDRASQTSTSSNGGGNGQGGHKHRGNSTDNTTAQADSSSEATATKSSTTTTNQPAQSANPANSDKP